MISILLVDDQPAVRHGLRMRLAMEPGITVVGEAGDGASAIDLVPALRPDVVVMDIEMPGTDGISATQAISSMSPVTPVVILTMYDCDTYHRRAMSAGAAAFVSKHAASELLPETIRRVACRA